MIKALVLFSGGLDSRVCVKFLQEQNLDVEVLHLILPFSQGCGGNLDSIKEFCLNQKVKLNLLDCTKGKLFKNYIQLLKKPSFSRGQGINPCKDCKIFIFRQAKIFAKKNDFEIIASGEVIGQRPLSQMKKDFLLIEKEVKLEGRILRPLCAKQIHKTIYEKKKLVNREKLLNINGRGRNFQINFAKEHNFDYPTPSGGCLLCEKLLKNRFKILLKREFNENQSKLIKLGKHFIINNSWIILGRNESENLILEKFKDGKFFESENIGPSVILFGKLDKEIIFKLINAYSKNGDMKDKKYFENFKI